MSASGFSKRQLDIWRSKSKNPSINPDNVGLVCRMHSGEQRHELKCGGPCGQWKAIQEFSGNQRKEDLPVSSTTDTRLIVRSNRLQWCKVCMDWKLGVGDHAIPFPAPNAVRSQDEVEEAETGPPRAGQLMDGMIYDAVGTNATSSQGFVR